MSCPLDRMRVVTGTSVNVRRRIPVTGLTWGQGGQVDIVNLLMLQNMLKGM